MFNQLVQLVVGIVLGAVVLKSWEGWNKVDEVNRGRNKDGMVYPDKLTKGDIEGGTKVHPKLVEHSQSPTASWSGKMTILKVCEGVWMATNYSYANIIIVDAPEGLIIVDTSESPKVAELALVELRKFNKKPIKAIVLSHYHMDHIQGVEVFTEDKANPPDVWAHYMLPELIKSTMIAGPKSYRGAIHQTGFQLSGKSGFVYPTIRFGLIPIAPPTPNRLVYKEVEHHVIAGLNVTFMHIPGETPDQLAVWLPEQRVVMPGDNIFETFPQIYAIRGSPTRDLVTWADSLRKMRALNAEYMAPAHTSPVYGQRAVYDVFTAYSSAIQYVNDQTVRRMNEHIHPDDIARMVRLPPALASHPWLGEFYGMAEWASKVAYHRYIGWYSGDPVDMLPLTTKERAQSLIDWLGVDRILDEADVAMRSGRTQWALELARHVNRAQPDNLRARWMWMQTLRQRSSEVSNPTARNYYLTAALDAYGLLDWSIDREALVRDINVWLGLMKYRLKAELTDGVNSTILMHFTDSGNTYRLQILYSVLEVDDLSNDATADKTADATITTTEAIWLGVLLGKTSAASAFTSGDIKVTGSLLVVRQFMTFF